MEPKKIWGVEGTSYFATHERTTTETLTAGIYLYKEGTMMTPVHLERISDAFDFHHKLYNVEGTFIDRVKKTFESTTQNLGILLNGIRGTGKTVTAKLIANKLQLPVIVITTQEVDISFLNNINSDVIIFIDEYEKIFRESAALLSIMDGVLSDGFRRVFLLTTNQYRINESLMNRPGRIRYKKEFSNLPVAVIREVVTDILRNKKLIPEVVKYIQSLQEITIDIVKVICQETDIHNESPEAFKDIMNIAYIDDTVDVYRIDTVVKDDKKEEVRNFVSFDCKVTIDHDDNTVYFNGEWLGNLVENNNDLELPEHTYWVNINTDSINGSQRTVLGTQFLHDLAKKLVPLDEEPENNDGACTYNFFRKLEFRPVMGLNSMFRKNALSIPYDDIAMD